MGTDGGSTYAQRLARRTRNTFSKRNMRDLTNVGNVLQQGLDKVIPREIQRKAKGKMLDNVDNYIDGMGVHGGSTYAQRLARRTRNTFSKRNMRDLTNVGNVLQQGLDKVIPREIQRKAKGKMLDNVDNYIDGMGVKKPPKSVRLPMSEIQSGKDYLELPSGVLEPNNIKSLELHRKVHGSSFRGSSFRGYGQGGRDMF
jgi:Zn-finger domain-containing protein